MGQQLILKIIEEAQAPLTLKILQKRTRIGAEELTRLLSAEAERGTIHRWPETRRQQRFWHRSPDDVVREQVLEAASECALPPTALAKQAKKRMLTGHPAKLISAAGERFFEGAALKAAERDLKSLVGRMAGVLPGQAQVDSEHPLTPPQLQLEHHELGHRLVQALEQYGPVVELRGSPIVGPTFLRYTIMPRQGVKVASIVNKAEDLQIRLGLQHAPMIQKAGGKLVIDVQRPDRQQVSFASVKAQLPAHSEPGGRSKLPLGVDLFGKLQFTDLAQTPHLLVAGTSGSGKTERLRSALAGLMYVNTPKTLRLALIDPKRQAFGDLKNSSYLWDAGSLIYPPEHSAADLLDRLIVEMEDRYRLFERLRVSDLGEYVA